MRNLPSYEDFLNEDKIPFELEKTLNSLNLEWKDDEEAVKKFIEKHKDDKLTDVKIKIATDKKRSRKYTFKTWYLEGKYIIELSEDKTVIFVEEYTSDDKLYYQEDCQTILKK